MNLKTLEEIKAKYDRLIEEDPHWWDYEALGTTKDLYSILVALLETSPEGNKETTKE